MTKRRLRPAWHIDAEHFHQLIVHVLSKPAHRDGDTGVEIALERQLKMPRLLGPEHAIGSEGRKRPLGRQPDSGHGGCKLFGAWYHRALRGKRFHAEAIHGQRDGEARAPQSRPV